MSLKQEDWMEVCQGNNLELIILDLSNLAQGPLHEDLQDRKGAPEIPHDCSQSYH